MHHIPPMFTHLAQHVLSDLTKSRTLLCLNDINVLYTSSHQLKYLFVVQIETYLLEGLIELLLTHLSLGAVVYLGIGGYLPQ